MDQNPCSQSCQELNSTLRCRLWQNSRRSCKSVIDVVRIYKGDSFWILKGEFVNFIRLAAMSLSAEAKSTLLVSWREFRKISRGYSRIQMYQNTRSGGAESAHNSFIGAEYLMAESDLIVKLSMIGPW